MCVADKGNHSTAGPRLEPWKYATCNPVEQQVATSIPLLPSSCFSWSQPTVHKRPLALQLALAATGLPVQLHQSGLHSGNSHCLRPAWLHADSAGKRNIWIHTYKDEPSVHPGLA